MIFRGSLKHRILTAFAALALLMRVAVPVGFMPASVAGGWYLELCPDGMPTQVMVALYGEHHAHHGAGSDNLFYECDYGGGATGALIIDTGIHAFGLYAAAAPTPVPHIEPAPIAPVFGFQPRGPPSGVRYS